MGFIIIVFWVMNTGGIVVEYKRKLNRGIETGFEIHKIRRKLRCPHPIHEKESNTSSREEKGIGKRCFYNRYFLAIDDEILQNWKT